MSNIIYIPVDSKLDWNPDRLLEAAMGSLKSVVIAGYTNDGEEYFAISMNDLKEANWLADRLKARLLTVERDV